MLTIKNRVGKSFFLFLAIALIAGCTPAGPRTLLKGQKLLEEGKYADAVEKLKTATSLLETNAQAWNYLGLAYHGLGQSSNAVHAYQQALALDRNLAETRYNLGCLYLEQNKLDAAKNELTTYTLRKPNSADGLLKLATAQLRARELGNAEKSFSDALRVNPRSAEGFNGLGLVLLRKNQARDAAQYFRAALKQQPNYAPAMLNLAVVLHQQLNDKRAALQKYREYLTVEPHSQNAASINEIIRQLDIEVNPPRPVSPIALATTASKIQTNVSKTLGNSVAKTNAPVVKAETNTILAQRNPATATNIETVKIPEPTKIKPALDGVLVETNRAPSQSTPNVVAAMPEKRGFFSRINPLSLFRRESKPTTPISTPTPPIAKTSVVTQVVALPTKTNPTLVTLAATNFTRYPYRESINVSSGDRAAAERVLAQGLQAQQQNRPRDAIIAFKAAAKADPSLFKAHFALGVTALQSGELSQALGAYETALTIEPDSADARYNFALALKQSNYFPDAANEIEKLLVKHPDEARGHLLLANLCAERFGQPKRAREHYLKVLELEPKHPRAADIRFWLAAHP